MLLIEHCDSPSVSNLKRWKSDIGDSQLEMAEAISDNPSLREECAEMLSLAWDVGRSRAVRRLAAHSSDRAEVVDAQLPKECPYLLEHVVGYDPRRAEEPEWKTYPPAVAKVLNRAFGGRGTRSSVTVRAALAAGRAERSAGALCRLGWPTIAVPVEPACSIQLPRRRLFSGSVRLRECIQELGSGGFGTGASGSGCVGRRCCTCCWSSTGRGRARQSSGGWQAEILAFREQMEAAIKARSRNAWKVR